MSESLRRELQMFGIDVILIEPGYVNTPILDKAEAEDSAIYGKTAYGPVLERFRRYFIEEERKGLHPEAIGKAVYHALTVDHPKVTYTIIKQKLKKLDDTHASSETHGRSIDRQADRLAPLRR